MIHPFVPSFIMRRYMKWKRRKQYGNQSVSAVFQQIYEQSRWGNAESASGHGSDLRQTEGLRPKLESLFRKLQIQSLLDIPCGDFYWMKTLNLNGITYIGADIVPDLIAQNQEKYESPNRSFAVLDLTADALPSVDLVLCRDCLVHLSEAQVWNALRQIKKSGATYVLLTSFPNQKRNEDIVTGDWRPINLEIEPFNLQPIDRILEDCPVIGYEDKSLLLLEVANIPDSTS